MRRQISRAILAVAVLLVVGLGLPLAVTVQRFYEGRAVADLHRRAAETIVEITLPLTDASLKRAAAEPDSPGPFTVYDRGGTRRYGSGPAQPDGPVRRALAGQATSDDHQGQLILAAPITDRAQERIVGAVRVTQSREVVDGQVRTAWLVIAVTVAGALAGAAALARAQGRRLAAPVTQLAEQATALGRGDFVAPVERTGISEVDAVAAALADSAERLAVLLARERAFSADVSHQLRTPLTGLRLRLERAAIEEPAARWHLAGALQDVDSLEATVEHLLALSRDSHPIGAELDLEAVLGSLAERWSPRLFEEGRSLRVEPSPALDGVNGSAKSLGQVLDVLVDNARQHGQGEVVVRSRPTPGGVVIEVADQGPGIADDERATIFERRHGSGNGIGLALARSIIEAEGGRLLLASARPPSFHIVLPASVG